MLISPGLEITVTDDSAYLPTAVGTVPLVLLATGENKTLNGVIASGTTKSVAGKLQAVTSQRELINGFGYPSFKQTAAGTPIHAHELNEYGLMAAYSALGLSNRSYVIRADIDTTQILGSAARPVSNPANGTYWLDTTETTWGIYEWDAATQLFANKIPTLVTSTADTVLNGSIYYPKDVVGNIGSYAVVLTSTNNYLFYKRSDNTWTMVGAAAWQLAHTAVVGTVVGPVFNATDKVVINTIEVELTGTSLQSLVDDINAALITGVTAAKLDNKLALYVTGAAKSDGTIVDGRAALSQTVGTSWTTAGIAIVALVNAPVVNVSTYASVPNWRATDAIPEPTGSVWIKSSAVGNGANIVVKKYTSDTNVWTTLAAPISIDSPTAIYAADPAGGGTGFAAGSLAAITGSELDGLSLNVHYRPLIKTSSGKTVWTGDVIGGSATTVNGHTFDIRYSKVGSATLTRVSVTVSTTTPANIVSDILAKNLPEISASYNTTTRQVTITHNYGGEIRLRNTGGGTALTTCGFNSSNSGVMVDVIASELVNNNFAVLTYTVSSSAPYTAPTTGTLWYYDTPLDADIMVSDIGGWFGYKNVSADARGYDLSMTDPAGPILSSGAPTVQSDGTSLVAGDLWIDTADLENFPKMYRYTAAAKWAAIDNTDRFSQNGIVFADVRWDTDGTVDPIADAKVSIADLSVSDYLDLDAPDYRLYPRGTLLFNMRRSGFNIKQYVSNYFTEEAYPDVTLPAQVGTWVTASGVNSDGSMAAGHKAQRAIVVKALKAAIDGSDMIREEGFAFNLIACPGYPELIPNMVALNNDRKNTAFIIGDTPMTMPANIVDLTAWSENTNGTGLSTADPYLGIYYPSGLTSDIQGNTVVVPASHIMLRTMIRNDNVSFPWFAPAGMRRGLVDNASDIGYVNVNTGEFMRNGINGGLRDALYSMKINPLTILPGSGLVVWGQKTRNPFTSAMDRVNVARLVNYIRTVLGHAGDAFLFEPNDEQTRKEFRALVSGVFNDLIAKRGIYDFLVVCDESNNTSDRIARNELYCDVAIEPMKDVEFIYIPIRLKNPGGIKAGV